MDAPLYVYVNGETLQTNQLLIPQCVTLTNMWDAETSSTHGPDNPVMLPLSDVSSQCVQSLLDAVCAHVRAGAGTGTNDTLVKAVCGLSVDDLLEWTKVADFLDITTLLDIITTKLARDIGCMNVDELREYLNVQDDFTPEERAKVQEEMAWTQMTEEQQREQKRLRDLLQDAGIAGLGKSL